MFKETVVWVISIVASRWNGDACIGAADGNLSKGSRISTKYGMGTIVGGSINIKLDEAPPFATHPNNKTLTFNLDKMTIKEKK